ncbi:MAG: GlsB/YeaQ/YmgE family stress response membrane protein [Acidimicrobiales bacterium]
MLLFILSMLILGAIAGFVARLLVPGRDPMSVLQTILLGIVGSFVGGFLGWAIFGNDLGSGALQPSGIIGSVIGAVVALLIYRAVTRRHTGRNRIGHSGSPNLASRVRTRR